MLCEGFLGVPAHYELWRSLFWVVRSAPGGPSSLDGGALIQLHPGMEDRYLSLDHYPSTDFEWQKSWLYIPNESPALPSCSPDRLCGDLLELWEQLPPMEAYRQHVPNLLDAIKDLKDRGLTRMRVIHTFIGHRVPPSKMRHNP